MTRLGRDGRAPGPAGASTPRLAALTVDTTPLKQRVSEIDWWHRIELAPGIVTPGRDRSRQKLRALKLPERMHGLSVLDVGAWDGFFSFEAERRGAERVLACDRWLGPSGRAGFDLACSALGSKVEGLQIDLLELSPDQVGRFDLLLFLGVLYHMRDPRLALERIAALTKRQLVLETHVDLLGVRQPAAAFYPGRELRGDPNNWWGPNPAAVVALLESVGFNRVEVVYAPSIPNRILRAVHHKLNGIAGMTAAFQRGRAIVHAYK